MYVARKDGFTGPIRLALKSPAPGFTAAVVTIPANQSVGRMTLKGTATATKAPVKLAIVGSAKAGDREIAREAVPAEDRMQAFLWRHLVPASELQGLVYDPRSPPPPRRVPPARDPAVMASSTPPTANAAAPVKPKFTKQQIAGRLRQLKLLYEEGLLADEFYTAKVTECETSS